MKSRFEKNEEYDPYDESEVDAGAELAVGACVVHLARRVVDHLRVAGAGPVRGERLAAEAPGEPADGNMGEEPWVQVSFAWSLRY